jgi:peptidoglycan/xylan/chitin deacetylase (PgdA/CDA1 family)
MIAITFDDGFRNLYEHAFPVLQRHRFPATVFLVTDYCGGLNSWPSQPLAIAQQPLLSWDQIKEMSRAGIAFGSHTRSHPILTAVSECEAEKEIVGSKRTIEDATGQSVSAFAYPYGSFHDGLKKLARAHFSLACATTLGFVQSGSDLFALDRIDMYYFRRGGLLRHLFSPAVDGYIRGRRIMRDLRRRLPV